MSMNSFGNYPVSNPHSIDSIHWQDEIHHALTNRSTPILPIGLQKSYGDSCLNNNGVLLQTSGLKKILNFDVQKGIIVCEAGCTLYDIERFVIPYGWFLPVTPGTKYITVGGAIANDVHGKNHHRAGSFGNHILSLCLSRSDYSTALFCSENNHAELFAATIGGLGLTGVIVFAEIQLIPIKSTTINAQHTKYKGYDSFLNLSKESESRSDYSVSWFDCFAGSAESMKGIFSEGNFSNEETELIIPEEPLFTIPLFAPEKLLNPTTIRMFNWLYFHKQLHDVNQRLEYFNPFFYPLDSIQAWNKFYGRSGFVQYQCVIPELSSKDIVQEMLSRIKSLQFGSFLVVLKSFGVIQSKGLLSFPMPGITIAMDFPWREGKTDVLLNEFDSLVDEAGGRVYAAKDARMKGEYFRKWYPGYTQMQVLKDPAISSTFWRRVME